MYDSDKGIAAVDNVERVVERFLRGEFDLVGVGRALLGDAEWARKAIAGVDAMPFDPDTLSRLS
jgi:2,4-dienoyl-CoA reductase-like NADH-dependent reductase (Old Yellow Enzyme family)